jgi:hypothetical protein
MVRIRRAAHRREVVEDLWESALQLGLACRDDPDTAAGTDVVGVDHAGERPGRGGEKMPRS